MTCPCGKKFSVDTPLGRLCLPCYKQELATLPPELALQVQVSVNFLATVTANVQRYYEHDYFLSDVFIPVEAFGQ